MRRTRLSSPMAIRTVFFDFGGTLARTWVSEGHTPAEFWQAVLERNGVEANPEAIRKALDETGRELEGRIYEYVGRTPAFWRLHDARVMDRLGIHERRELLADAVDAAIQEASLGDLYSDALPTLASLSGLGVSLGVISNHNDALREILSRHGLSRFFDTVTYSQEAGAEKPDPRVFDLALRRAKCEPGEAIHVGDSWVADYLGATRAGLRGIWLNRKQSPPPEACESVSDLRGILALLSA